MQNFSLFHKTFSINLSHQRCLFFFFFLSLQKKKSASKLNAQLLLLSMSRQIDASVPELCSCLRVKHSPLLLLVVKKRYCTKQLLVRKAFVTHGTDTSGNLRSVIPARCFQSHGHGTIVTAPICVVCNNCDN